MAVYNSRQVMLVLLSKGLVMTDTANSASPGQCWQPAGLSQQSQIALSYHPGHGTAMHCSGNAAR